MSVRAVDMKDGFHLCLASSSFVEAARTLYESKAYSIDQNMLFMPSFYTIVGLSFELSCKSYLEHRGYKSGQLKQIGHDLNIALNEASSQGLQIDSFAPLAKYSIDAISDDYKNHKYRYPKIGSYVNVMTNEIEAGRLVFTAKRLQVAVGWQIGYYTENEFANYMKILPR
jgi:hypothetical protein